MTKEEPSLFAAQFAADAAEHRLQQAHEAIMSSNREQLKRVWQIMKDGRPHTHNSIHNRILDQFNMMDSECSISRKVRMLREYGLTVNVDRVTEGRNQRHYWIGDGDYWIKRKESER